MNYDEARPTIRSGDLLAWGHEGWGSLYDIQVQAVRVFTRSEYSHVGVAWLAGGRVFVIESVSSGVRIYPLSRLVPFYHIPVGLWTTAAEEFALAHVGDPYSKWQAVKAFFGLLAAGADAQWQCAEFSIMVLRLAGLRGIDCAATPTALVRWLLDRGFTLRRVTQ